MQPETFCGDRLAARPSLLVFVVRGGPSVPAHCPWRLARPAAPGWSSVLGEGGSGWG